MPIIVPHLLHGYHLAHIFLHIGGITLAVFISVLAGFAYYRLRTKRLLLSAAAFAKFWLDKNDEALKYKISIENMDISGFGDPSDDVTKLHLHESEHGAHVLNVYKAPGQDDADLVVKSTKGIIKGIWDDSDENLTYEDHYNNSQTFTSQLETLCGEGLFTMIHGGAGVLKGDIELIKQGEKACKKLGF